MGLKVIFIQFGVLLLKNCLIIIKHPKYFFYMYIPPVILSTFMMLGRHCYGLPEHLQKEQYTHFPLRQIIDSDSLNSYNLIVSPESCQGCVSISKEIQTALKDMSPSIEMKIKYMADCKQLEYYTSSNHIFKYLAGICFSDQLINAQNVKRADLHPSIRFPSRLRYTNWTNILKNRMWNWQTSSTYRSRFTHGYEPDLRYTSAPGYFEEGALLLIYLLMKAIHVYDMTNNGKQNNTIIFPSLSFQRFTEVSHSDDDFFIIAISIAPIIIMICYSFVLCIISNMIVVERDIGLKEYLKISGAKPWIYWLTWLMFGIILMLPVNILILYAISGSFFFKELTPSILPLSSTLVVSLFLFLYSSTVVSFALFFSFFLTDGKQASKLIGYLFIFTVTPYYLLGANSAVVGYGIYILLLLLNSIQAIGIQIIFLLEIAQEGTQIKNLNTFAYLNRALTMEFVLIILLMHCVLYYVLALFMESQFPGKFGAKRIWHWRQKKNEVDVEDSKESETKEEKVTSESLKIGISTIHLRKIYQNYSVIKDFNFDVHEEEVTVIFGYNNSGKTACVYMLTGMCSPTEGNALVNGYNIKGQLNKIRQNLGYCPQHLILFDELSVYHNIYIHGKLRGLSTSDVNKEVEYYTKYLRIDHLRNVPVSLLNIGDKKKLQVAITFTGGPKIIIMDEPTSRLDYTNTTTVWELLDSEKLARTILITTRNADEAYYVGDRIAILKNGYIQACGTKMFLTNKYNLQGYNLFIIKDPQCQCNTIGLKELVETCVPKAIFKGENEMALKYTLIEDYTSDYSFLFRQLDLQKQINGIKDYTLRKDTLDTAYIRNYTAINEKSSILPINFKMYRKAPVHMFIIMMYRHIRMGRHHWYNLFFKIFGPAFVLFFLPFIVFDVETMPPYALSEYSFSPTPVVIIENSDHMYREIAVDKIKQLQSMGVQIKHVEKGLVDFAYTEMLQNNSAIARLHVLYGIQYISDDEVKCWFNGKTFLHVPALCALNAIGASLNDVSFHPLPYDIDCDISMEHRIKIDGITVAALIIVAMCFMSGFSIIYYSDDSISKFRQFEFFHGGSRMCYWTSAFVWDFLQHMVMVFIIIFLLFVFQIQGLDMFTDIGPITALLITFGLAYIPLLYILSSIYHHLHTAFVIALVFLMIIVFTIDIIAKMSIYAIYFEPNYDSLSLISPYFVLGVTIYNFYYKKRNFYVCQNLYNRCVNDTDPLMNKLVPITNQEQADIICRDILCKENDVCCDLKPLYYHWSWPGLYWAMIYFTIVGVICFLALLIKELTHCQIGDSKKQYIKDIENDDETVMQEKNKVRNFNQDQVAEYQIVVRNLSKYFHKRLLIKGICFAVPESECISLYGNNGCGKSLILDLVSGVVRRTQGSVWIEGALIKTGKMKNRLFAYSADGDYLTSVLTVSEIIIHTSLLCGYSFQHAKIISQELCAYYNISAYYFVEISKVPNNIKKNISNALTFIGDPSTIIFDEPTIGMSPREKLVLWNNILYVKNRGTTILLCSKDIYECQLLSSRIAVISKGSITHIGSIFNLKTKLTSGAILTIEMVKPISDSKYVDRMKKQCEKIIEYLSEELTDMVLLRKYMRTMIFHIKEYYSWSQLFDILQMAKRNLPITSFTLEEHSLYHGIIMMPESSDDFYDEVSV